MAPERFRKEDPPDRRVDVYALGIVLYELLTCSRPFNAVTEESLLRAILYEPLVPARSRRPDLPVALEKILEDALAKDREQRYSDCGAFQMDLEQFILKEGGPVTSQHLAQGIKQVWSTAGASIVPPPPPPLVDTPPSKASVATVTMKGGGNTEPGLPEYTKPALPAEESVSKTKSTSAAPSHTRRMLLLALVGALVLVGLSGLLLAWGGLFQRTLVRESAVRSLPSVVSASSEPSKASVINDNLRRADARETALLVSTPPRSNSAESAVSTHAKVDMAASSRGSPSASLVLSNSDAVPGESKIAEPVQPAGPTTRAEHRPPPQGVRKSNGAHRSTGEGTLEFRIRPYATVFLGNEELGETPLAAIKRPAGTYVIRIINHSLGKSVTRSVTVTPNQISVVKVNLFED